MPEYAEVFACAYTISRWYTAVSKLGGPLRLQAIWIDATDAEKKAAPPGSNASLGMVYKIDSTCTKRRGSRSAQQLIWPQDAEGMPLPDEELGTLVLEGVTSTPRTVVILLGAYCLHVHLQTHCTVQPYTAAQFHNEVRKVDSKTRGFRVPFALDFGSYVLTFASLDNLCTPLWCQDIVHPSSRKYLDVITAHRRFLDGVARYVLEIFYTYNTKTAEWTLRKTPAASTVLATTVIRETLKSVFGGVGVYTVLEIFFKAGLSPFFTAGEVFCCASRTSRLCEAFWQLAYECNTTLPTFLEPNYAGYVLAPSKQQRLKYSYRLHVFGKKRARMSERMKRLCLRYERVLGAYTDVDANMVIRSTIGLYDVFEPTLIEDALSKPLNLGHLIFGIDDWAKLSCSSAPPVLDSLTAVFQSLQATGKGDHHTHLDLGAYEGRLMLDRRDLESAWVDTNLYMSSGKSQKSIWSITSQFPATLVPPHLSEKARISWPKQGRFALATPRTRHEQSFDHIIHKTRSVVIGPLEFCGTARLHFRGGASEYYKFPGAQKRLKYKVAVCADSPILTPAQAHREKATRLRMQAGRQKDGAVKQVAKNASCPGGWHDGDDESLALDKNASTERPEHPSKRRRLSADAKLALGL